MKTRNLVLNGLMIALVCIATMVIQIPTPGTNGFVNIGDSVIFITSILFGPFPGMIAGGIGSALADVLSGYSHWALFTLIIKGTEGYIVGCIVKNNSSMIKNIIASTIGAIVMVFGYFIAGGILEGSFLVSAGSIPSNMIQGGVSVVLGVLLVNTFQHVNSLKSVNFKS